MDQFYCTSDLTVAFLMCPGETIEENVDSYSLFSAVSCIKLVSFPFLLLKDESDIITIYTRILEHSNPVQSVSVNMF